MKTISVFISVIIISIFFACEILANKRHHQGWKQRQRGQRSQQLMIDQNAINQAITFAESSYSRLSRLESSLGAANVKTQPGSSAHRVYINLKPSTDDALIKNSQAQIALKAFQYLKDSNCPRTKPKDKNKCISFLNTITYNNTILECPLQSTPKCDNLKYRTLNGTCNNLQYPNWGSSLTAYKRLLPSNYDDGVHSSRGALSLPNAKQASNALINDVLIINDHSKSTLYTAIWSHFVNMDLSHTPVSTMSSGNSIACCKSNGDPLPPRSRHPSCSPIIAQPQDGSKRCTDFVRSLLAPRPDCKFGPAEQMNQATHWLDASPLYGSNDETLQNIREFNGGKLILSNTNQLLPLSDNPIDSCHNSKYPCFKSGDSRINEQTLITSLITIFAREHNRIADILSKINPQWDDEILFQETRNIIIAEIQHITYNEWLPQLIGEKEVNDIMTTQYSPSTDPSILNSVASLSMLPSAIEHVYYKSNKEILRYDLDNNKGKLPIELINIADEEKLRNIEHSLGLDTISLVVQRGRDHGIQSYNSYRVACGLKSAKYFNDFVDVMDKKVIDAISKVYRSPNDVDLYIGILAERLINNTELGPTLTCLFVKQMKDTRQSDRFFYDLSPGMLNRNKINEIKKTSLARIICDNIGTEKIQSNVFRPINDEENSMLLCSSIPTMNLHLWKSNV